MKTLVKKFLCLLGVTLSTLFTAYAGEKLDEIVLSGPFASVSHPMIHMVETGALLDIAKKVKFVQWKNPDELRAQVIQKAADFIAVPTNVALNLYNKKQEIQLVNVSVWGILGMVTLDKTLKTLKDFVGKEVVIPFRGDMPDIVFNQLIREQGLNPKTDFNLIYVSSPIEAMRMLIMRRADHVLLVEPATSMAMRKTKSFPISLIAPEIYRSADIQTEWGNTYKTEDRIPQAGIAVLGKMRNNSHVLKRFMEEYGKSLQWYKNNPEAAGELVAAKIKALNKLAISDSIKFIRLKNESAIEARERLEFFYKILKNNNPKSIGGNLPDDNFYARFN